MKSISLNDMAAVSLQFAKTDVLFGKLHKAERQHNLLRAMLLNYHEHQLVRVFFKNIDDELFGIECSVIAVTDDHVMLKSGLIIPVKSIEWIELL